LEKVFSNFLHLIGNILNMGELYFFVGKHLGGQTFSGVVRAHSIGLNIEYHNEEPIQLEITNINPDPANHLVGEVVLLGVKNKKPLKAVLKSIVKHEAAQTYIRI
jgi:hypothetical protein